jgi:hypothetical protein
MPPQRVTVYPIPGARSAIRALGYLVFDGNDEVDAWPVLRRIDSTTHSSGLEEQDKVQARFRDWLAGVAHREFHHGWSDDQEFSMGYVFRWDHQRQHRRLYGFLGRPRPRLEVCILCCFRAKDDFRTDPAVKRTVRAMSQHPEVQEAVKRVFGKERRRWTTH